MDFQEILASGRTWHREQAPMFSYDYDDDVLGDLHPHIFHGRL